MDDIDSHKKLIKKKMEIEKREEKDDYDSIKESSSKLDDALKSLSKHLPGSKTSSRHSLKSWWKKRTKWQKRLTIGGIFVAVAMILVLCVVVWWTGVDSVLIKSQLEGTVTDTNGKCVPGVLVQVTNKQAYTDSNGYYKVKGLKNGKSKVLVSRNGYKNIEKTVSIGRYKSTKDFELSELPKGSLSGRLIADFPIDLSLVEARLEEMPITINQDGSFVLEDIYKGSYLLSIQSSEFVDIVLKDYQIYSGENDLGSLTLTKAADIRFELVDWVNDKPLKVDLQKINIGVDFAGIQIEEDVYYIRDFTLIDRVLTIEINPDGYLPSSKTHNVIVGLNDLEKIILYPDSQVVYQNPNDLGLKVTNLNNSSSKSVFSSKGQITDYYYNVEQNRVYALVSSQRDDIYAISLENEKIDQITPVVHDFSDIYANFETGKTALISHEADQEGNIEYVLYLSDLSLSNPQEIFRGSYEILDVLLSNDGKYLYYMIDEGANMGIYKILLEYKTSRRISSAQDLTLYGIYQNKDLLISQDGKSYRIDTDTLRKFELAAYKSDFAVSAEDRIVLVKGKEINIVSKDGANLAKIEAQDSLHDIRYQTASKLVGYMDSEGFKVFDASSPQPAKLVAKN